MAFDLSQQDFLTVDGFLKLKSFELLDAGKQQPFDGFQLKLVRFLGNGSYGHVHLFSFEDRYFAVKILASHNKDRDAEATKQTADHELQVAQSRRFQGLPAHASLVRTLGYGELDVQIPEVSIGKVLVTEYCCYGDCHDLLDKLDHFRVYLPEPLVWQALVNLVMAINHLTKPIPVSAGMCPKLLMMDHKLDNVFITKSIDKVLFKLGDFGHALPLYRKNVGHLDDIVSMCTVAPFNAPEWPLNSPKSELFCVVQVVYLLATLGAAPRKRDVPEDNEDGDDFSNYLMYSLNMIQSMTPPGGIIVHRIPKTYSDDLQSFFEYVLVEDPAQRPSVSEALARLHEMQAGQRADKPWTLPDGVLKDVSQKQIVVREDDEVSDLVDDMLNVNLRTPTKSG